jgi:hypothetical protein
VITDLLEGQYINPVGVVGLNVSQGWVRDVSEDVVRRSASDVSIRTAASRTSCKSLSSGIRPPKHEAALNCWSMSGSVNRPQRAMVAEH